MNERSFAKKEIWEEDSFAIDASHDSIPAAQTLSNSMANIEPTTDEIKEELKAQE